MRRYDPDDLLAILGEHSFVLEQSAVFRDERVGAAIPRALLIRAEGKVWTGGVDVNMFQGLTPETGGAVWRRGFELIQGVEDLPFPVIFAAHALTLTWGFELALACDLIVAGEGAQFGLVEIVVGLTPSMGGPQRLAEKAGPNRAKDLVMSGQLFDAATMKEWGVVTRVWPDDEFDAKARKLAARIASGPTVAHAAIFCCSTMSRTRHQPPFQRLGMLICDSYSGSPRGPPRS